MKLTVISQDSSLLPNVFKGSESKITYSLSIFALILFASPFATTHFAKSPAQKSQDSLKVMHAKSTVSSVVKK